jgi:hypothetical protein
MVCHVKNAEIFRKAEKEGKIEELDFNNVNYWIYELEENLVK